MLVPVKVSRDMALGNADKKKESQASAYFRCYRMAAKILKRLRKALDLWQRFSAFKKMRFSA